jgi:hypothetical protein
MLDRVVPSFMFHTNGNLQGGSDEQIRVFFSHLNQYESAELRTYLSLSIDNHSFQVCLTLKLNANVKDNDNLLRREDLSRADLHP